MANFTLTVTAKVGPGFTDTAAVIRNCTSFTMDNNAKKLSVVVDGVDSYFDVSACSTFTVTMSSGVVSAVTVS